LVSVPLLSLPLIELKNPADVKTNIVSSFHQLQTYKETIPDLFNTNEILVIADGREARAGSLTADIERFTAWRTIDGKVTDPLGKSNETETLVRGLFQRDFLLEYIRDFIIFEDDGEIIKKIAAYHQFHAVRKAYQETIEAVSGEGKIGVVWHTQGSGKSISMAFYAGKIITAPEMKNPTIVVVTDRNDLDGQLFKTFSDAKELMRETPKQADTRQELRELLQDRPSGGVIFTTIQKFSPFEAEKDFPTLSERQNIIVIADEAHRTQYGLRARIDQKSGEVKYGYAYYLREALPNASFIAFTGTPVSATDRDTRGVFGDYIDIYDMKQSQDDGATVPIYYESRLAKLNLREEELPKIDAETDELTEDEEESAQARLKTKWAALEKIVGSDSHLKKIAADYEVLGLAPTTGAAQELDSAKITSSTLQKLLASTDLPRSRKRFFIVDESSFVSSRQMDKFFRDAVKTGDRVLLVEDTHRREGVKAVKPPVLIEGDELSNGANVRTIKRQTKKSDRRTVKNLPEEKIIEAVGEMRQRGQIREIKDRDERLNSIVEAFASEPEKSLVVAPRDVDRQEINRKIHTALKEAGKVGEKEIEIKILRPRNDISGTEREFAAAYEEGDRITYTRGSKENEIPAKSLARVVKIDREQNLLTVEIKDGGDGEEGREITYNPKRLRGVSVWTEETIKVSEGDRLQFRAPFEEKKTKIASGAMFEVSKVTQDTLTLKDEKGKTVKLKTDQPHAIDYGYAITSHSSQGKTIDRILIHAETSESKPILNERMARVAISRARDEALIFTDDAEKLVEKMAWQIEKTEISQIKAETIEFAPEHPVKIILDAKLPVEKADRSEIKQPIILPSVEILTTPAVVIEPKQQTAVVSDVKSEVEPEEIKPSAIVPLAGKPATPAIEIQPAQEDVFPISYSPTRNQEILIKELVQLSRDTSDNQGFYHSEKAWNWLETVELPDLATREMPENHRQFVDFLQKDLPESGRVNLSVKSELESTHAILKLIPIEKRETIVNGFFADYYKSQNESERVIEHAPELAEKTVLDAELKPTKIERGEINQPEVLSESTILPTPEIKTPQPQQKPADSATDTKKRQDTLITEVLQMSRESLARQGIKPDRQAWKRFANVVSNDLPVQEAHESQKRTLEVFQKIAPPSERVSLTGKSSLEATHAILKTAPENRRDAIVKSTLARYEKQVLAEHGEMIKPEIKEVAKTASFEKATLEEVKPTPRVRNFEAIGREELIRELVADARDAVRTRASEDFSYKQEKRLTKMYRQVGDNPPSEQQTTDLSRLQEQFSEPLPQPKDFIEATVLILDNSTEAEKSARLRGQMIKIDELIKREEARKTETAFEQTVENDPFGRTDSYFTQELHRMNFETHRKSYFELTKEAEQRNLIEPYTVTYSTYESMQEKQMQQALYQMGIANALQEQIKKSLEEQEIKIEPSAQKLIDNLIDTWAKQPPSATDYKNVEEINQSRGIGITPRTKLEANAYIFAKTDNGTRDKISSSIAAEAGEKAAELKVNQAEEVKRNREMTQENPYTEGQTQTRGGRTR
jgi:hypothetical protein